MKSASEIDSESIKMDTGIEVIGKGNVGDKARQLIEKTPALRKIGFYTPKRIVLAEDYFNGFFHRNGFGNELRGVEPGENLEKRIIEGSFSFQLFTIVLLSQMFINFLINLIKVPFYILFFKNFYLEMKR